MSNSKVEDIRARRAKISEDYEIRMDDDTDDDDSRPSACLVLYVGGTDWFAATTEQEGNDVEFVAHSPEYVAHLLTKLDEAERKRDSWHEHYNRLVDDGIEDSLRANAVEEREHILIAGVKEALAVIQRDIDRLANLDAAELKAILSRLLPSTPTEEGKNDE